MISAIYHAPGMKFLGAASGQTFTLGPFLSQGGEGTIYALDHRPGQLAKIYKERPSPKKREKLSKLASLPSPPLRKVAALPEEMLLDRSGQLAGFVMPEIVGARPLHQLITPADRLAYFSHFTYADLVHVAANLARLVAAAHEAGIVIGDVNTNNILVRADGTVRLVDCDSVQLGTGLAHRCEVFRAEFTAPELHFKPYQYLPRRHHHDTFALAVIVFALLFTGRHPYAGNWRGDEELEIDRAIRQGLHCLRRFRARTDADFFSYIGIKPKMVLSPEIVRAFRSAFGRRLLRGNRPSAEKWRLMLETLRDDLVPCRANAQHHHTSKARSCPWCEVERRHGALFKPTPPAFLAPRGRTNRSPAVVALLKNAAASALKSTGRLAWSAVPLLASSARRQFRHRPRLSWSLTMAAVLYVLGSLQQSPPTAPSRLPSVISAPAAEPRKPSRATVSIEKGKTAITKARQIERPPRGTQ